MLVSTLAMEITTIIVCQTIFVSLTSEVVVDVIVIVIVYLGLR